MDKEQLQVVNNTAMHRFELEVEGKTALISYRQRGDDTYVLYHTEVPPEFEGKGIGSHLVKSTLEQIKAAGKTFVPLCPFVAAYVWRHPEYEAFATR